MGGMICLVMGVSDAERDEVLAEAFDLFVFLDRDFLAVFSGAFKSYAAWYLRAAKPGERVNSRNCSVELWGSTVSCAPH